MDLEERLQREPVGGPVLRAWSRRFDAAALLMRTIGGGIARRCARWHENALSHSPRQV